MPIEELVMQLVAAAKDGATASGDMGNLLGLFGAAIGAGIATIGAALGISRLAASAVESIARQPEAGGRIFTSMIITAAFIEGVALFAVVVCFLAQGKF